jgi:hypothetical protein
MIDWPKMSPDALTRLMGLPIWDIVVLTEGKARLRMPLPISQSYLTARSSSGLTTCGNVRPRQALFAADQPFSRDLLLIRIHLALMVTRQEQIGRRTSNSS